MKIWQIYEKRTTGEMSKFLKLKDNSYQKDDGSIFTLTQLTKYFKWIRTDKPARDNYSFIVTPNGFKVRVPKNANTTV